MGVKQGNNQVKNTCKKLTVKFKMVKKDNFTSATVFKMHILEFVRIIYIRTQLG